MDWLAFSLSNQQPCFFEPFHPTAQHDRREDEAPPPDLCDGCPKLENFLREPLGRFVEPYGSELKSIAARLLGSPPGEPDSSKTLAAAEEEPKKAVDTFGQRTSIYRGVTRHRWTGRYEAHLWDNSCRREGQTRKGRQVYLGGYDKEEKAARAYDLAALKYWGPTTTTNFPVSNYGKELEDMKNMTRQEFVASLRRKSSGFSRGASIYRGVTRHHQHGRWQARIGRVAGNKDLYLGTFSTQEEAAEAYDIAAIKFRGPNAVTNFDISRYDVKSIMSSNLPIGGMSARTPSTSSSSSHPPSPSDNKPAADTLSFALPIRPQPVADHHDYWSLLALHQQQPPYFNLFPQPVTIGNGYNAHSSGNVTALTPLQEDGSYSWPGDQNPASNSAIPYATPLAANVAATTATRPTTSSSAAAYGGSWVPSPVHPYSQPATIFGIE